MSEFVENRWNDGPFLFVSVADAETEPAVRPHQNVTTLKLDMGQRHHRGFWAMQLDEAAQRASEPQVIVAHGLACLAVVRWAQLSPRSYFANVAGAVLLSPLSFTPAQSVQAQALLPSPAMSLPFPSTVVERRNDVMIARVLDLVDTWKSRFVEAEDFAGWPAVVPTPIVAERVVAELSTR
jgi:predicted alpha/beta hydrolase family esterase